MNFKALIVMMVICCLYSTKAVAQDRYEVFVGQYAAAHQIASTCKSIAIIDPQAAGNIAKSKDGLYKQKVLRLIFYSATSQLVQAGKAALLLRKVDPKNDKKLCRFGRKILGKDDKIGRFLRKG